MARHQRYRAHAVVKSSTRSVIIDVTLVFVCSQTRCARAYDVASGLGPSPPTKTMASPLYTRRNEPDENEKHGLIYSKERGVDFTSKGDRLVVKYNFFKMTFDPQARAREDVATLS